MPWVLRMTLILLSILILIYLYLSVKISNAVKQITNVNQKIVRFFAILIPLYLISYPLIGFIGYLSGFQGIIHAFRFGDKTFDAFFTYPFWFGLVFAIQAFFPILIIDSKSSYITSPCLSRSDENKFYLSKTDLVNYPNNYLICWCKNLHGYKINKS
ncbi:hypothetical protein JGI16_11246 [Candidatus Kryptonium thompsonii]|nr:hypothetical protein JGI16_11246 [Candidatus Kryptonium thompsoni]